MYTYRTWHYTRRIEGCSWIWNRPKWKQCFLVHPARQASKPRNSTGFSCSDRWSKGLEQIISQAYPLAKQQRCLIHISRNLASKVKRSDRAVILEQFKTIYRAENLEMAVQALEDFIAEWKPKYRKIMESLENTDNLLTFYQFPYQIWHSIYSTNIIESLNKENKRQTKKRFFFLTRKLWNVT